MDASVLDEWSITRNNSRRCFLSIGAIAQESMLINTQEWLFVGCKTRRIGFSWEMRGRNAAHLFFSLIGIVWVKRNSSNFTCASAYTIWIIYVDY